MHFDAHARAHISCVTLLGQFVGHFCGSLRGAALGPWAFVGHFVGHFCGSHAVLEWVTFARRKTTTTTTKHAPLLLLPPPSHQLLEKEAGVASRPSMSPKWQP